jgi:hypothetical protein
MGCRGYVIASRPPPAPHHLTHPPTHPLTHPPTNVPTSAPFSPLVAVVSEAVHLLTSLCAADLMRKRYVLLVAEKLCAAGLLRSRSTAVRAAAVRFVVQAASALPLADVQAQLLPLLIPHLVGEPLSLRDAGHLTKMLRGDFWVRTAEVPISRQQPVPPMQPLQHQGQGQGQGQQHTALPAPPRSPTFQLGGGAGGAGAARAADVASASASGRALPVLGMAGVGAHSMLTPRLTSSYSLHVDHRFLHPGASYLTAALEQSTLPQLSLGQHLAASAFPAGAQRAQQANQLPRGPRMGGGGAQSSHPSAAGGRMHRSEMASAADAAARLIAGARRHAPVAGADVDSTLGRGGGPLPVGVSAGQGRQGERARWFWDEMDSTICVLSSGLSSGPSTHCIAL